MDAQTGFIKESSNRPILYTTDTISEVTVKVCEIKKTIEVKMGLVRKQKRQNEENTSN